MKKLLNFFEVNKNFPFLFKFFSTMSIYILLYYFIYDYVYIYIIKEDSYFNLIITITSSILYYYLSHFIKYSNNKFFRFLQDLMLILLIVLIVTILYIILISIDYLSFFNIINLEGTDVEKLSNEVSNNISNSKFQVEVTKNAKIVEVSNITVEKSIVEQISKISTDLLTKFMNGIVSQIGPAAAGAKIGAQALKITSLNNLP